MMMKVALIAALCVLPIILANTAGYSGTITVTTAEGGVTGETPPVVGCNLSHFPQGLNAPDWWSYLGATAARIFIAPASIEPIDDIPPYGDNVFTVAQFQARKTAMRAAELANNNFANDQYVMWSYFLANYNLCCASSDIWYFNYTFPTLSAMGVDMMIEASAAPTRFPIANTTDYGGMWEVWQNYYAQSYYLARTFGVKRWSLWNEPDLNGVTVPTWYPLFSVASDAVQAGVADAADWLDNDEMEATIYGPTTAQNLLAYNGTTAPPGAAFGNWGQYSVQNRHVRWNGTVDPTYRSFQGYDIHYYSSSPPMYVNYLTALVNLCKYDVGPNEPGFGVGYTEHNSNTAANYDLETTTLDDGTDYSALGAVCIASANNGVDHMYVFKFGQTARLSGAAQGGSSTANYPVQKNGLLYANNTIGQFGGITQGGEVWRLFNIAALPGRDLINCALAQQAAFLFCLATFDQTTGNFFVYFVNGSPVASSNIAMNLAGLPVPANNFYTVREVSTYASGDVVSYGTFGSGLIVFPTLLAYSVHLVTVPARTQTQQLATTALYNSLYPARWTASASDWTVLGDGTSAALTNVNAAASATTLSVVNGLTTPNTRRVAVLKFGLPAATAPASLQLALLSLTVTTLSAATTGNIQAHVYGLNYDAWTSGTLSWSKAAFLAQGQPACAFIMCNVVLGQGTNSNLTTIQGQLLAQGGVVEERVVDVTPFVRKRLAAGTGFASFVIAQDSRKDVTTNGFTTLGQTAPGDVQADGISIVGVGAAALPVGHGPQLWILTSAAGSTVPPLVEVEAEVEVESE